MPDVDPIYHQDYYRTHCGTLSYDRTEPHWARFFGTVADNIVAAFAPRSVFDAGCAHGFLMESLADRGVAVRGRDLSHFAIEQVRPDIRAFAEQGSLTDPIEGRYDLVTCIEVLEHMSEADGRLALDRLCAAADTILFSSSPDDVTEPTHINVRPTLWWLERFAERGFAPLEEHAAGYLTWHAFAVRRSPAPVEMERVHAFAGALLAGRHAALNGMLDRQAAELAARRTALETAQAQLARARPEIDRLRDRVERLLDERDAALAAAREFERKYLRIKRSSAYRMTAPYRAAMAGLRKASRRLGRFARNLAFHTSGRPRGPVRTMLYRADGTRRFKAVAALERRVAVPAAMRTVANSYQDWVERFDTLTDDDRDAIRLHIQRLGRRPLISVVVPVYDTPAATLREMVGSVRRQLYGNWELCIADDASPSPHVAQTLQELAAQDPRIKWMRRETNGHIAAASNSALALATGAFVALLDHDDLLAERALYEIAVELDAHPGAEIVFSDEDKIDADGVRYDPYFKPDYSYEQMLGQNMINHLGVYRRASVEAAGGFRPGTDGSQDYDLALRILQRCTPQQVRHIPAVLYHWRQASGGGSFSQSQLERCVQAARTAIQEQLDLGPTPGTVLANPFVPAWNRVRWALPSPAPRVSIIIPTRDRAGLVRQCVEGLLHRTDYGAFEIIIVDNGSVEAETFALFETLTADPQVRVLRMEGAFNYSALNNAAAAIADGEVLLLLNNDIDVIESHWLEEMVSLAMRPDVGAVGARLLYGDGRIQHAGVRLGAGQFEGGPGIAGHVGLFEPRASTGYFGQLVLTREVGAVTGACLALRREVYRQVGGLNEDDLKVAFNDIDLCLKIREAGYRILWTPFAELYHLESASRGADTAPDKVARFHGECRYMLRRWQRELANDPFYNPNFDNAESDNRLAFPARRRRPWRT